MTTQKSTHCGALITLLSLLWPNVLFAETLTCWDKQFTEESCCQGEKGNEDCWDGRRYTYDHCCLGVPYIPPTLPPTFAKQWRVVTEKDIGGWMVHELEFYPDCSGKRVHRHGVAIESGHKHLYFASYAFDGYAEADEHTFWYSNECNKEKPAFIGATFARPVEVNCVKIWHNNIPSISVQVQKHNSTHWVSMGDFDAKGGDWAMLNLPKPSPKEEL